MSMGTACKIPEHREHFVVDVYKANYSAFNGYHRTPSDYSEVRCAHPDHGERGPFWRTKAAYVDDLVGASGETGAASARAVDQAPEEDSQAAWAAKRAAMDEAVRDEIRWMTR